jgi:hypothetical protein
MAVMEKPQAMRMRPFICENEVTNQLALPIPEAVNLDPLA